MEIFATSLQQSVPNNNGHKICKRWRINLLIPSLSLLVVGVLASPRAISSGCFCCRCSRLPAASAAASSSFSVHRWRPTAVQLARVRGGAMGWGFEQGRNMARELSRGGSAGGAAADRARAGSRAEPRSELGIGEPKEVERVWSRLETALLDCVLPVFLSLPLTYIERRYVLETYSQKNPKS